jgi:sn-glycerol 3-phosphate transport system substrate-binding protein
MPHGRRCRRGRANANVVGWGTTVQRTTEENAVPDSIGTDGPIVIEAWLGDSPKIEGTDEPSLPGFGDPIVAAAESFNREHPEYQVRVTRIDFRELPGAVAAAVAAGNPPDLAEYVYTATQLALDARTTSGDPLFVPVQRAIGDRTEILGEPVVVDDLLPAVRDYYSFAGELLSIPTSVTNTLLFADKVLLDRAGIDRLPDTWPELTDACAAIAALPDGPDHAVAWANYGWLFHTEVSGQGGTLGNHDNGRTARATEVRLDGPELLNYVRWWKDLNDRGHYLYTDELNDFFGTMQAFMEHKIAFVITSSAVGQDMADMAAAAGIDLLAGHSPRNDERPYSGGPFGGQSFFLAAGLPAAKEDGALAFLQHQINPEFATARLYERSLPMTRQSCERAMAGDEPHVGLRAATAQVASPNLTAAAAGPLLGDLNGINQVMITAMEDVLRRGADPAERFRAATEEAQKLLDRHNEAALADPPVNPDALWIEA